METNEIESASQIAMELWNGRVPDYPAKIVIKSYQHQGNLIVADACIYFKQDLTVMDGLFTVGNEKTSWDDPMEFVYGWLECIEESFSAIYE